MLGYYHSNFDNNLSYHHFSIVLAHCSSAFLQDQYIREGPLIELFMEVGFLGKGIRVITYKLLSIHSWRENEKAGPIEREPYCRWGL